MATDDSSTDNQSVVEGVDEAATTKNPDFMFRKLALHNGERDPIDELWRESDLTSDGAAEGKRCGREALGLLSPESAGLA